MIRILLAFSAFAFAFIAATDGALAAKSDKAERLVRSAAETAGYFASDSAFEALWELSDDAKAMVIIPQSIRAGFIFGGSAGDAVMIARNEDGGWSQPTFMTIGSFSFGFQAGGEASETILLVMTKRGMEQLLSTSAKIGADLTIAAGPIGAGAKAQTTDILAFSRSRGLYGGVSLEGAVLKVRHNLNEAYYGAEASPADIIYRGVVYNPGAATLQNAVFALANRDGATPIFAPARALEPGTPQTIGPDGALQDRETIGEGGFDAYGDDATDDAYAPEPPKYEDDAAWGAPVKRPDRRRN